MTVGKVQGTTVTFLGSNGVQTQVLKPGEKAVFNFNSNTVRTDNAYEGMGLSLSSKLAEPQGDEKKPEDKAPAEAKGGTSVSVGDNNGTTIIIIGDNNEVNVGETDKAGKADKPDEAEDPDKAEETPEEETPDKSEAPENPNQKIIDTLKDIITKLLELIGVSETKEPKAEDKVEEEKPADETPKEEKPAEEKPAEEKPAAQDKNAKIIETLKQVILLLLGLVEAEPAKKADEAEDKEKKDKTEEVK